MVTLKGGMQAWWIVVIILIFAAIGLVVFILRKKIPGLTHYDENKSAEDEANENVNSVLSSLEEEQKIKDLNKSDEDDEE